MRWRARNTLNLSQCQCDIKSVVNQRENVTWGVLFTPPVGCSRLLSAVNDLTTTNYFKNLVKIPLAKQVSLFFEVTHCMSSEVIDNVQFMSFTSVHSTATMWYWMKKTTDATFGIDRKELVQVALLQIYFGDGAYLKVLLGSLIGVSLVHFFLICSVLCTNYSDICRTLQAMDNRSGFPVLICLSQCTFLQSSQSRECLQISLCSSILCYEILFLCFSSAVPSTTKSLLLDDVVWDW